MPDKLLIDAAGWVGAGSVLLAYGLVSLRKLDGDAVFYQVLNLVGAIFLILNSFYYGAYPSVGVNVVWISIGLFSLIRARKRTHPRHSEIRHD
jgi:hypothetical protein